MARPKMILTADQVLTRKAMAWATKVRVNPSRIVITELKTKWGSCAPDGVVTFSEDLVDMPEDFQDYVVVHELLHLRYRSQGKTSTASNWIWPWHITAMITALVPGWRDQQASSAVREVRR